MIPLVIIWMMMLQTQPGLTVAGVDVIDAKDKEVLEAPDQQPPPELPQPPIFVFVPVVSP